LEYVKNNAVMLTPEKEREIPPEEIKMRAWKIKEAENKERFKRE
jgi:hypothetical protein